MEMDDMARQKLAGSVPVSSEGDMVRRRRERLGMHKNELAEAAGVSRDTLAAIEAGEGFRRASLTKIERALDAAEEEAGFDAPPLPPDDRDVAAQTRSQWPQDVQVFLDVMGVYLSSMDEDRRKATIRDLIQQIVAS